MPKSNGDAHNMRSVLFDNLTLTYLVLWIMIVCSCIEEYIGMLFTLYLSILIFGFSLALTGHKAWLRHKGFGGFKYQNLAKMQNLAHWQLRVNFEPTVTCFLDIMFLKFTAQNSLLLITKTESMISRIRDHWSYSCDIKR